VILTDTTYAGLLNRVVVAGGVPKTVPFVAVNGEWRLDHEALASAVTPKTRAMLLMSPSMPSGAYLDRSDWMRIAQLADQHDLWIIYDAAMERILYDGRSAIHPASLPGMAARVITVGAASKELRMIGWRVGWIVAPAELMGDLSLISMANVVVPVGIAQDAVASALEAGDCEVTPAVAEWERRRDVLLRELAGLPVVGFFE
jgi:N-succinyldiaminopimelate aminotransferase